MIDALRGGTNPYRDLLAAARSAALALVTSSPLAADPAETAAAGEPPLEVMR
jgi:hypothetical protein